MKTSSIGQTRFVRVLSSPAARETSGSLLIVPVGSTEQHGPHLPLTTDTDIAVALADMVAANAGEVVVAPALCYGASGEHASFPGTLSIGNDAVELVLTELVRSATETWRRVLLISTHGGNTDAVRRAVKHLRSENRDVRAWFPHWPGDAHAGNTETSIMLCIAERRVDRAAAEPGAPAPLEQILGMLRVGGVASVSENGVLGDPTNADPLHGRELLDAATNELLRLVEDWPEAAW